VEVLAEYASWVLTEKNLKSKSVFSYIHSLKVIHSLKGLSCESFDSQILKAILRGGENLEIYKSESRATRKAMNLPLLKLIGHSLANTGWSENTIRVIWSACCLAFFGSLRMGELLPRQEDSYSLKDSFLWEDVKVLGEDHVLLRIKCSKTRSKEGDFVDIFSFKGHGVCPVKAITSLKESLSVEDKSKPVFCFSSGKCLTTRIMNDILKHLLLPHIGPQSEEISGHSFRAAIPSVLAKFPEISNSEEIMGWGRWKSSAYLLYTRLKNDQKRKTFSKISDLLSIQ
jgi:hypothetical protein